MPKNVRNVPGSSVEIFESIFFSVISNFDPNTSYSKMPDGGMRLDPDAERFAVRRFQHSP
jgi:hypothetical protein